jgi:hypothetical protein
VSVGCARQETVDGQPGKRRRIKAKPHIAQDDGLRADNLDAGNAYKSEKKRMVYSAADSRT